MENEARPAAMPFVEFVTLIALIISLVALSIDSMLPALPQIAHDLGLQQINDSQYVITVFFAGLGLGQMVFGPVSDAIGRKAPVMIGFTTFICGCVLTLQAQSFDTMLIGRFLQGFGAAAPRIVAAALVRDLYRGREMARVMSFVMAVFILVPVFAPALGQLILELFDWRAIFAMFLALTLVLTPWFWLRQPETLPPGRRIRLTAEQLMRDSWEILSNRSALGYTLAMGFLFGSFVGYLSSSQQIFQVLYGLGDRFPLYFGLLAGAIGCATLVNARLVMRLGMRRLCRLSLWSIILLAAPFLFFILVHGGQPALPLLMSYLSLTFFFFGVLFGNMNALAMEPLGHIAGLGSAVVGSVSTLIAVLLGILIADSYNQTVIPLVAGFGILCSISLAIMYWAETSREREPD